MKPAAYADQNAGASCLAHVDQQTPQEQLQPPWMHHLHSASYHAKQRRIETGTRDPNQYSQNCSTGLMPKAAYLLARAMNAKMAAMQVESTMPTAEC